jgi:predicted Zn-dependent protease
MKPIRRAPGTEGSSSPLPRRDRPTVRGHGIFNLREWWWWLLDLFEASRAARVALYLAATAVVAGGAVWFWAYPAWNRRNAVRIARAWLAAGQLRYAAEAAQTAAAADPANPEPWLIAAELARRGGQQTVALNYARRAAELAPTDPAAVIGWAAAALRADEPAEADRALDGLPIEQQALSPHVQRLRGELARREGRLTPAMHYFEAARRLEGPAAINEVPLGLILLNAADPAERQRGLDLLRKWAADRDWGAAALRMLLEDAFTRDDRPALRQWAAALRAHPACTVADMPRCLLALAKADAPGYAAMLASLKKDHAATPQGAAQLLSWLNQIGRGADAVEWMRTLPAGPMQRPPLVVAAAEALRQAGDWSALRAWTEDKDWGPDANFLRWTYGLQAAHMLGENRPADELWSTLYSHAQVNGVHGLFAASQLYSWGREQEAEDLWWRVADQEGQVATEALGSLARLYQTRRDAEGQYRVFRQLHFLRPQDRAVGNNFAFFAALTDREPRPAEQASRENLAAEPGNPVYAATRAFVLLRQSQAGEALALLRPLASGADKSPALAFVYGLALAGTNRKAEARPLLTGLPPETLTLREVELIKSALAD